MDIESTGLGAIAGAVTTAVAGAAVKIFGTRAERSDGESGGEGKADDSTEITGSTRSIGMSEAEKKRRDADRERGHDAHVARQEREQ